MTTNEARPELTEVGPFVYDFQQRVGDVKFMEYKDADDNLVRFTSKAKHVPRDPDNPLFKQEVLVVNGVGVEYNIRGL